MIMDLNFTDQELFEGGIFIMLAGPPGSGKTQFARNIKRDYMNFKIVCPDDIRKELFGNEYDNTDSKMVYEKVYELTDLYLADHCNIVYDANNCRTSYRHEMIDFIKSKNSIEKLICVVFTTSLSKCLSCNNSRSEKLRIPDSIIKNMWFSFKKHSPTILEGYDAIFNMKGLH